MAKLYVVPTPVGNMEDMTFRAVRILKEADLILAEDTRTSSVLLHHYGIQNEMLSHHKFNEHQTIQSVVGRIQAGSTVALISDAGTPGISDPGFLLVRECVRNGIEVEDAARPDSLCSRACFLRSSGRPLLFRRVSPSEKRAPDPPQVAAERGNGP
jgi:16S rRNA (cytidine(1402)-2'-O)-methyltransferase